MVDSDGLINIGDNDADVVDVSAHLSKLKLFV